MEKGVCYGCGSETHSKLVCLAVRAVCCGSWGWRESKSARRCARDQRTAECRRPPFRSNSAANARIRVVNEGRTWEYRHGGVGVEVRAECLRSAPVVCGRRTQHVGQACCCVISRGRSVLSLRAFDAFKKSPRQYRCASEKITAKGVGCNKAHCKGFQAQLTGGALGVNGLDIQAIIPQQLGGPTCQIPTH